MISSGYGAKCHPPTTACTFSIPVDFWIWRTELMMPAWPHDEITTSPRSFTLYAVACSPQKMKDRGLVVISSCGHAGIINSVRQIQKSTGIEKVHAVVGGWHLAPYPDEIIAKTVETLKEINPDYLIPMHCTGLRTMMAVQREMR